MLEIKNVRKSYLDFQLDCSMDIKSGQITGFVGENGAGKSTTFKAILDLIKIDSGTIKIMSKKVSDITVKEKIGVVLSDSGFSGYLTINQINKILKNTYNEYEEEKFLDLCNRFNLPLNKQVRQFSTGMKAKLKVFVAITHNADLLLLDEPTAGLDVVARDEILGVLREYMEEKPSRSILIGSHISSDLESLCDDIYMISKGRIVFHEDTDVLLSDYAILKVDENKFNELDKEYLLKVKKEIFGYVCLTNQKQYYIENYPDIVVERNNIDELMLMMIRGENLC